MMRSMMQRRLEKLHQKMKRQLINVQTDFNDLKNECMKLKFENRTLKEHGNILKHTAEKIILSYVDYGKQKTNQMTNANIWSACF